MDRRTALGALAALTALPAAAGATPLRLLSFNILAPLWADARWYLPSATGALFSWARNHWPPPKLRQQE